MNVLITGAASGIGRAAVDHFTKRGHNVFGIDIIPADEGNGLQAFVADSKR